ncbi:hypothetical protein [Nonomuraea sp. NPDC049309]
MSSGAEATGVPRSGEAKTPERLRRQPGRLPASVAAQSYRLINAGLCSPR